jgi:hypothetical protein
LWREIHVVPTSFRGALDEMPSVQKNCPKSVVHVQFAESSFDFGREESRIHGLEAGKQGGVRTAIGHGARSCWNVSLSALSNHLALVKPVAVRQL